MATNTMKRGGFDWEVYFVYLDGENDSMAVTGCWTAEDAIAEARTALAAFSKGDDEKDEFEIVAVVRSDARL